MNYKFRGKAIMPIEELNEKKFDHENGWVYGNLIENGKEPFIVGNVIESTDEYINFEYWLRVHEDSIGEFTGIADVNDKEIFDGDLIKPIEEGTLLGGKFYGGFNRYNKIEVVYSNRLDDLKKNLNLIEVIGNIYDNPEKFAE